MKFLKLLTVASVVMASSSANAALIERLGGLAYYDDVAKLTWLADANTARTEMNWADANNWAAGLTVGGVDGWRLPGTLQPDASCDDQSGGISRGYDCTGSEMGNLFYNVLGGTAATALSNTGPFSNVQFYYWSSTEYAPSTSYAWLFPMDYGVQGFSDKTNSHYAWAVQSGDVSPVPVPAAVWLFGSGLIGLAGLAKRKKRK